MCLTLPPHNSTHTQGKTITTASLCKQIVYVGERTPAVTQLSPTPHQPFHHMADIASEAKLGEKRKRTGRIMYSVWEEQLSTRYISAVPKKETLVLLSYSNTAVNSLRMSTAAIASVNLRGPSTLRILGYFQLSDSWANWARIGLGFVEDAVAP